MLLYDYKSYNQWGSPMTSGLLGDRSEKVKLRGLVLWTMLHTRCVSALFY